MVSRAVTGDEWEEEKVTTWDVFISYASEDRPIAQELAEALNAQGLDVWYDETVLTLGDSLRRSIDHNRLLPLYRAWDRHDQELGGAKSGRRIGPLAITTL